MRELGRMALGLLIVFVLTTLTAACLLLPAYGLERLFSK